MRRVCELCGYIGSSGMHHGVHTVCNKCMWEAVKFAITAEMKFRYGEEK